MKRDKQRRIKRSSPKRVKEIKVIKGLKMPKILEVTRIPNLRTRSISSVVFTKNKRNPSDLSPNN